MINLEPANFVRVESLEEFNEAAGAAAIGGEGSPDLVVYSIHDPSESTIGFMADFVNRVRRSKLNDLSGGLYDETLYIACGMDSSAMDRWYADQKEPDLLQVEETDYLNPPNPSLQPSFPADTYTVEAGVPLEHRYVGAGKIAAQAGLVTGSLEDIEALQDPQVAERIRQGLIPRFMDTIMTIEPVTLQTGDVVASRTRGVTWPATERDGQITYALPIMRLLTPTTEEVLQVVHPASASPVRS